MTDVIKSRNSQSLVFPKGSRGTMCYQNATCSPQNRSALNETGQTRLDKTDQTASVQDESGDEDFYTPHFSPQVDIIGIFLALVIVLFNSMVFILVAKKRSLRTTTNYFLMGLAASDFLDGAYQPSSCYNLL